MQYIGRFAPSPTGPLHFGSLVTAVASYLEAKKHNGLWLVRMEDLDKPREVIGAANNILRTLETFGFEWDKQVLYQSQRHAAYEQALQSLTQRQLTYRCTCTRKEITETSTLTGFEGNVYPGTCLKQAIKQNVPVAWRVKTQNQAITFDDAIQGKCTQNLKTDIGDFVLKRADNQYAYQLAVVIDDEAQSVTHVVRGADLLHSTPRQIYLQNLFGFASPQYMHIPVAANADGQKLSKQTLATALNADQPSQNLWQALDFLNQSPPTTIRHADLSSCWDWAITHWDAARIAKVPSIKVG